MELYSSIFLRKTLLPAFGFRLRCKMYPTPGTGYITEITITHCNKTSLNNIMFLNKKTMLEAET